MRKTFLAITLFLAFSKAALAQFGNCTASEMRTYVDSATGNTITMLTDTMKNGKHSNKCTFYTLRFGCSFAAVNTIKPQLL